MTAGRTLLLAGREPSKTIFGAAQPVGFAILAVVA